MTSITDAGLINDTNYHYAIFLTSSVSGLDSTPLFDIATPTDQTPPAPVTNLVLTDQELKVYLQWDLPADLDLDRIVIRRSDALPAPTSIEMGYSVASLDGGAGPIPTDYYDTNVVSYQTYYYSVFAVDSSNNASSVATDNATPFDTIPPANASNFVAVPENDRIALSWQNPVDVDFTQLVLCRKNAGPPASSADCDFSINFILEETSYTDVGLSTATTYYYALFSGDSANNFSPGLPLTSTTDYNTIPAPVFSYGIAQDNKNYLNFSNNSMPIHFNRYQLVRNDGITVASDPTDGVTIHNSSSSSDIDYTAINGNQYTYTLFAIEDDEEWVAGDTYTLTPLTSAEFEFLGPIDFDGAGEGIPIAFSQYSSYFFGVRQSTTNLSEISISRMDATGTLSPSTEYNYADLAADEIKIKSINSGYPSFGVGFYHDSVSGEKDLTIWDLNLSPPMFSNRIRHNQHPGEDEVGNTFVYDTFGQVVGGYSTTGGQLNSVPTLWRIDSSGNLVTSFEANGEWIVPTLSGTGEIVDHVEMTNGTNILLIQNNNTTSSLVAVSLTNTNADLVDTFGTASGELFIPNAENGTIIADSTSGNANLSFPIYVAATTLGNTVNLYSIDSLGDNTASFNAGFPVSLSAPSATTIEVTSMIVEASSTIHVLGTVMYAGGDTDIAYWRYNSSGALLTSKVFVDGEIPGFNSQISHQLLLHSYSNQIVFTGLAYDGAASYEILFGRISND
jgi:hypothetical protein